MPPADDAKIREIADRVVAALAPEWVVLFGSYAWGRPDADSDIDLYVIVADRGEPVYRLTRRGYHALRGMRVPVDLVVRTRGESERNAGVVSTLDQLALTRGVPLYG
jgi:predicted nucleotidyltransferase